ncbi:electron transfer flavoprotein subunit alpha/FixB family protein [Aquimarina agarilytica]|uniref:electron transfer flavoprotein subunit alpha/FixB family protein n=1 Tax=Aquimarina agarilytica TaxID=1087449 RepID=UPI000288E903|nr:electron transfer flavoprotein subunit alpha/FixB family protein [Aquimarina agarilytica]
MSVLIYAESDNGSLRKGAFEVASYAKGVADALGTTVTALTVNVSDVSELGNYGVSKVLQVSDNALTKFQAKAYSSIIEQAAKAEQSKVVVLSSSTNSKYAAPLLGVALNAAVVSNVVSLPKSTSPFVVERTAFTNKAFQETQINSDVKVICVSNNSYGLKETSVSIEAEAFSPSVNGGSLEVVSIDKATDKVSIADAEVVVSGGRGLKGPENWHLIEDLATVLGAATACSKPVSDMGWRPHSEHVGQTGKPVATNLYIAVGISGAIQHLAGINASKVKVVVNTDPEAPFFKAADYGVVGDAFEVVPQLIEKLKAFKSTN